MNFELEFEKLRNYAHELLTYYDIDKISASGVYIWTKGSGSENVFDIYPESIYFYDNNHNLTHEAKPIIKKIQNQLKKLDKLNVNND